MLFRQSDGLEWSERTQLLVPVLRVAGGYKAEKARSLVAVACVGAVEKAFGLGREKRLLSIVEMKK